MSEHTRRDFMLAAAAAAAARMVTPPTVCANAARAMADKIADAGPLIDYPNDDVYSKFRENGFFIIRRKQSLFALSSVCTHKGCNVRAANDLSFFCKCHGSTFDKDGRVTKGPATRNLPRLAVQLNDEGHVLVDLDRKLP